MTKRHRVGFAIAWLSIAVLASSCGGRSTRSSGDAGTSGGPVAGGGGDTVVGGGGSESGTAGTAAMPATAGAPSEQDGPSHERCVQGERCNAEGSECTDSSGCCVVLDTCFKGHWTEKSYLGPCKNAPPAPPFICPAAPAKEGTACGACVEECHYDTCTPDGGGSNLIVQCTAGKWAHFDAGCLECCQEDSDCPGGACVNTRCVAPQSAPGCYRDVECGTGRICSGVQLCHCGSPCNTVDQTGVCVPDDLGCCATDADCASGKECVAGKCKQAPPTGSCWTNRDCAILGLPCGSPVICPCGANCAVADTPGQCLIPL